MSRTIKLFLILGLVLTLFLSACGSAAPEPAPAVEEPAEAEEVPAVEEAPAVEETAGIALKVIGSVAEEQGWSEDAVKAMNVIDVESTNSKGETDTYTGVLLTDLLTAAQPNADAATVVFVADDGYTSEVSLEELNSCIDCIVSFRNKGGFRMVLPGFPSDMQVKGVVEIQVK